MNIFLEDVGKRYNNEWIFKGINLELNNQNSYAILGSNGSGKSTLLQVIAGNIIASTGSLKYNLPEQKINADNLYKYISFASPYIELIEEFTLLELLNFHFNFKKKLNDLSIEQIIEITELQKSAKKEIKYYSSGMKQRVRLALAILSDTPILLLDEPVSNLDKKAVSWYHNLIQEFGNNKLKIICSNQQEEEYSFCNEILHIEKYK